MPEKLTAGKKVVGLKQTSRAVRQGNAALVYVAADAEERLRLPLLEACRLAGVPTEESCTMKQLGQECGISVGTAAVAVLVK